MPNIQVHSRCRVIAEMSQSTLTSNEMALLLSLPPPPPPPSPPTVDDSDLQLFYAQLNADETEQSSALTKPDPQQPLHQHHHKEKKSV